MFPYSKSVSTDHREVVLAIVMTHVVHGSASCLTHPCLHQKASASLQLGHMQVGDEELGRMTEQSVALESAVCLVWVSWSSMHHCAHLEQLLEQYVGALFGKIVLEWMTERSQRNFVQNWFGHKC